MRMKYIKRVKPLKFLIWLVLILVLAACSQPGSNTPTPTPPAAPEFSVSQPFVKGEDGTYTATISENQVNIQGSHNGALERLQFKLRDYPETAIVKRM
jgi:uncharacterized lipoprotein YajG